jgi:hypothetical protein
LAEGCDTSGVVRNGKGVEKTMDDEDVRVLEVVDVAVGRL